MNKRSDDDVFVSFQKEKTQQVKSTIEKYCEYSIAGEGTEGRNSLLLSHPKGTEVLPSHPCPHEAAGPCACPFAVTPASGGLFQRDELHQEGKLHLFPTVRASPPTPTRSQRRRLAQVWLRFSAMTLLARTQRMELLTITMHASCPATIKNPPFPFHPDFISVCIPSSPSSPFPKISPPNLTTTIS